MRETLSTTVARLVTDPATARRIGYGIAECFEAEAVAASVFEQPDGRWSLALHFRARPDEAIVRALVAAAGGEEEAAAMVFETLAATDWVRKSREGLAPVDAGRFVVHGAHDRARAGTNRIGIEIEAGLAFGTGHHGSTRGCLVALDRIVAAAKPPRRMPATFPHGLGCNRRLCPRERMKAGAHRRRGVKAAAILDIGTGTGVLAIAAAKALRRPVLASDIDARAVAIARANARANGAKSGPAGRRAGAGRLHRMRKHGQRRFEREWQCLLRRGLLRSLVLRRLLL